MEPRAQYPDRQIQRLQRERRTLARLIAKEERKDLLKKLRNAQRLLSPVEILNPYAPALTSRADASPAACATAVAAARLRRANRTIHQLES